MVVDCKTKASIQIDLAGIVSFAGIRNSQPFFSLFFIHIHMVYTSIFLILISTFISSEYDLLGLIDET